MVNTLCASLLHMSLCFAIDSDPSEETPLAARTSVNKAVVETPIQPLDPPIPSQTIVPDTPPAVQPPVSHRKGGRPPNARKGKLGKNQYTKDRDLQEGNNQSPQRSQSRDVPRAEESSNGTSKSSFNEGKSAKSKTPGSKVSMADARKRVGNILDYISRTQLEMAGDSMSQMTADSAEKTIRNIADGLPMIKVNGKSGSAGGVEEASKKAFEDLSCSEMMDNLTRQLVKWQKEHA
jgi:hypothetical protein